MSDRDRVIVCGGDMTPGPRDSCPDPLHDHPLPSGYIPAHEEASRRLRRNWRQRRCRKCGLYGWITPTFGKERGGE